MANFDKNDWRTQVALISRGETAVRRQAPVAVPAAMPAAAKIFIGSMDDSWRAQVAAISRGEAGNRQVPIASAAGVRVPAASAAANDSKERKLSGPQQQMLSEAIDMLGKVPLPVEDELGRREEYGVMLAAPPFMFAFIRNSDNQYTYGKENLRVSSAQPRVELERASMDAVKARAMAYKIFQENTVETVDMFP